MENNTNEVINEEVQTSAAPEMKKHSVKEMGMKLAEKIKNLFSAKNRTKTCLVLLAVMVVIGCIAGISAYHSPKAVAKRYVKAGMMQDNATVCKLTAYDFKTYTLMLPRVVDPDLDEEAYFEQCSEKYDEDIASWKDLFAVQKKLQKETWEDTFGEYKLTVEVTREKDISAKKAKSELKDWLEMLEDLTDFDPDTVEDCKVITAKIKLIGEDETQRDTAQIYLCKVNGAWKVLYHG